MEKLVFLQGRTIFAWYVYDGILVGPCKKWIDQEIGDLGKAGFDIEFKVNIENCLGINIDQF